MLIIIKLGGIFNFFLDGSFKYVETKVKRKYSNLSYGKYYISELSDQNCQNLHSKQITENVTKKRQYEHKKFPLLKVGQCIAVEYSDSLESKYEYYSNTKSTTGKGNRRVSIKLVREISSKKILAEWIGYSGSSVMSSSESCGYEDKNLPFKKVLL
ncbi:hypothetical protein [Shewanella frigidimarina]|uniref:hypothetical protein n=1 Tax=Shewanella frigidimarina TaxID=56812 RepID=UPI003D7930EB